MNDLASSSAEYSIDSSSEDLTSLIAVRDEKHAQRRRLSNEIHDLNIRINAVRNAEGREERARAFEKHLAEFEAKLVENPERTVQADIDISEKKVRNGFAHRSVIVQYPALLKDDGTPDFEYIIEDHFELPYTDEGVQALEELLRQTIDGVDNDDDLTGSRGYPTEIRDIFSRALRDGYLKYVENDFYVEERLINVVQQKDGALSVPHTMDQYRVGEVDVFRPTDYEARNDGKLVFARQALVAGGVIDRLQHPKNQPMTNAMTPEIVAARRESRGIFGKFFGKK